MTDPPPLRILLIEDSRTQIELVRMNLEVALDTPFTLKNEDRLANGLQQLSQAGFDLLLLDLNVIDSVGFATFLTAKAAAGDVPIVITSGEEDAALAERAVQEGARGYLVKGEYTSETLAHCIRLALDSTT